MTDREPPATARPPGSGSRTPADGTAVAVDVSGDRKARATWVVLLGGPVIWFTHFMVVYLVAEAGCTGGGPGLRVFDPPVPDIVTIAATAVAAAACLACAAWGHRRWRASGGEPSVGAGPAGGDPTPDGPLALIGLLLSLLSFVTVLFVGVPALVLPTC